MAKATGETDWTTVFQNIAVDAEPFFAMNPEYMFSPDQFRDFMNDLQGCVIGRELGAKFGWKTGDRFFLQSFVPGMRKKSGPFEFVVRGFLETDLQKFPGTEAVLAREAGSGDAHHNLALVLTLTGRLEEASREIAAAEKAGVPAHPRLKQELARRQAQKPPQKPHEREVRR